MIDPVRARPLAGAPTPVDVRVVVQRAHAAARMLIGDRPAVAWSLALLFLFKGSVCLTVAAFPISAAEPVGMVSAVGAVGVTTAFAVWLFARRIPVFGLQLLAAAGSLTTSAMVAQASTHGGMMLAALAYIWTAIYAAHFFSRRAIAVQGLVISAGFAVGLWIGQLPHVAIYWVVVTATNWSICILLGNLSESLRRSASTDPLTGLLNRTGFYAAASRARARADRNGNRLTVAVIDLDGFKQVNDSAGHAAGDRLLSALGREMRARVRAGDLLARHGGDEFVLLLNDATPTDADQVLARLRNDGHPIQWSSGCSEWFTGEPLELPLARADVGLYTAKHSKHALAVA